MPVEGKGEEEGKEAARGIMAVAAAAVVGGVEAAGGEGEEADRVQMAVVNGEVGGVGDEDGGVGLGPIGWRCPRGACTSREQPQSRRRVLVLLVGLACVWQEGQRPQRSSSSRRRRWWWWMISALRWEERRVRQSRRRWM